MDLKNIIYEKKDFLAWITLNRPNVRNAQNDDLRAEILWALEDSRDDDDVRIIILAGAGDKAFSAGADISEFPKRTPADILRGKGKKRMTDLLREIPKPAIAMVNGLALSGGCELAMACDIIIASENAQFGQPEINVGVIPGAGSILIFQPEPLISRYFHERRHIMANSIQQRALNILLAYDGSQHAQAAVDLVRSLPLAPRSAITVLGVLIPRESSSHAILEASIAQSIGDLEMQGLIVNSEVMVGDPAETLINYAEELDPDIVVVGAKGLRATLGILLGGVAQQVVE